MSKIKKEHTGACRIFEQRTERHEESVRRFCTLSLIFSGSCFRTRCPEACPGQARHGGHYKWAGSQCWHRRPIRIATRCEDYFEYQESAAWPPPHAHSPVPEMRFA